jgi:hypothetical protein
MLYCATFTCISYDSFSQSRRNFHILVFSIAFHVVTNDSKESAVSLFRCICFEDVGRMFLRNVDNQSPQQRKPLVSCKKVCLSVRHLNIVTCEAVAKQRTSAIERVFGIGSAPRPLLCNGSVNMFNNRSCVFCVVRADPIQEAVKIVRVGFVRKTSFEAVQ